MSYFYIYVSLVINYLFICLTYETVSQATKSGLELSTVLLLPPSCWDYRRALPHLTGYVFLDGTLMAPSMKDEVWCWASGYQREMKDKEYRDPCPCTVTAALQVSFQQKQQK